MSWLLIQTKPAAESVAQTHLERQGYRTYYPRYTKSVRRRRQWFAQIGPLFPGYLFLEIPERECSMAPVCSTKGVVKIVRFGSNAASVPDQVIEHLQAQADAATGLHKLKDTHSLRVGTTVRVAMGPLDGLEGILESHVGAERVCILLSLLGQTTRVQMSANFVVPVAAVA